MSTANSLQEEIARALLAIGAVTLRPQEPFTFSSGLKSPIYCDNRLTLSYPDVRDRIAEGFVQLIREKFPETEVIAGTATAGIPHAAWVAQKMNLPMIYVRDKAKGHGKQNRIEGVLKAGQKTVVIEDLISTGGSSLKAALAVREAGGIVLGTAAIFTYELEQSRIRFDEHRIPLVTLSNYTALVRTARDSNLISDEDMKLLTGWKENPEAYGKTE